MVLKHSKDILAFGGRKTEMPPPQKSSWWKKELKHNGQILFAL